MCTSFYLEPETDELKTAIESVKGTKLWRNFLHAGDAFLTSGDIQPSNVLPVIAPNPKGRPKVYPMRWGFKIPNRSLVINARVEKVKEVPEFKEAWEKHRCIIPAAWYYEREHLVGNSGEKTLGKKYMFQLRNAQMTWLAGLYRIENGLPEFVILTREASGDLKRIHERMPVVLPKKLLREWVKPDENPDEMIRYSRRDMIMEICLW